MKRPDTVNWTIYQMKQIIQQLESMNVDKMLAQVDQHDMKYKKDAIRFLLALKEAKNSGGTWKEWV